MGFFSEYMRLHAQVLVNVHYNEFFQRLWIWNGLEWMAPIHVSAYFNSLNISENNIIISKNFSNPTQSKIHYFLKCLDRSDGSFGWLWNKHRWAQYCRSVLIEQAVNKQHHPYWLAQSLLNRYTCSCMFHCGYRARSSALRCWIDTAQLPSRSWRAFQRHSSPQKRNQYHHGLV